MVSKNKTLMGILRQPLKFFPDPHVTGVSYIFAGFHFIYSKLKAVETCSELNHNSHALLNRSNIHQAA